MLQGTNSQEDALLEHPDDANAAPLLTVVGSDAKLEGKFDIAGSIEIECEVSGELKVGGKLVIGERGSVHADVQTVGATIHGEYEGNMVATGSVEVTRTARVHGSIETNALVISKGGVFNGNVVKLKESEDEGGPPSVSAVEERAEEVLPGDPHPDEGLHPGDRPGRGGRGAGRDRGSGDTLRGASAGHAVDDKGLPRAAGEEAAGGQAERGGGPEPGGPLAGTRKRRGRGRPVPQTEPKRQGNTSDDPSEDKETNGPGVMDEAAPAPHPATAADPTAEEAPLEAGATLFPTLGPVSATAPTAPSETSSGWHAGPRSSKLLVRLEGRRITATEHMVKTVSGKILGGIPVRLVLYVNGTGSDLATENGSFRVTVPLKPGLNNLRVVATDGESAESEDTITVVCDPRPPTRESKKYWWLPWSLWTSWPPSWRWVADPIVGVLEEESLD